jgi:NAD(P)H-dependent flavin oxidoreductase YrpB (nitropropane dioxygenase family)
MLQTRFCERFGLAAPIVAAPIGPDLTGPELVAAVCNAGRFGILRALMIPDRRGKSLPNGENIKTNVDCHVLHPLRKGTSSRSRLSRK